MPQPLQGAVLDKVAEIAVDPRTAGKALVGRLRGLWSARVGSYRVIYSIDEQNRLAVRAVRHRAVAYGPRRGA